MSWRELLPLVTVTHAHAHCGTSLGVSLEQGVPLEGGHEHHLRAVNRIRGVGSIKAAVEQGVLTSGIMHALVLRQKTFVLVGSVRDDGPLPDVYTDVIEGQRAMRRLGAATVTLARPRPPGAVMPSTWGALTSTPCLKFRVSLPLRW